MELRKGMPVAFLHDELGWMEGTLIRRSPNGEEWLVRTKFEDRWVPIAELYPAGRQPTHS